VIHPGTVFEALRSSVQRAPSGSRNRFFASAAAGAGIAKPISRAQARYLAVFRIMSFSADRYRESVSAPDGGFVMPSALVG
jgi:hypothetical protein